MYLSASHILINGLVSGDVDPAQINRIISYGTILKPGCNLVVLYKMVAEFNCATYVQIDYQVSTIYWHNFFDRVLLYMLYRITSSGSSE